VACTKQNSLSSIRHGHGYLEYGYI